MPHADAGAAGRATAKGRVGLQAALLLAWALGFGSPTLLARESVETVRAGAPEVFIERLFPGQSPSPGYRATATTYFLHVPDGYDARRAYPLILAVSPIPSGRFLFESWRTAARKHGILFACPNDAGNEEEVDVRGQKAVDTLFDVRSRYNIDPERIYVTGFSGGGRMSTALVLAFPERFAGHVPIGGIFLEGDPAEIRRLRTRLGHYIFCGERDPNREESEEAAKILEAEGIPHHLWIVPGLDHAIPRAEQGAKIWDWILGREKAARKVPAGGEAPARSPVADEEDEKERAERAIEALERAATLEDGGDLEAAIAAYRAVAREFPGTAVAAEAEASAARLDADPRLAGQRREGEARRLLQRADNLTRNGRPAEAREVLRGLAREYPDCDAGREAGRRLASEK